LDYSGSVHLSSAVLNSLLQQLHVYGTLLRVDQQMTRVKLPSALDSNGYSGIIWDQSHSVLLLSP